MAGVTNAIQGMKFVPIVHPQAIKDNLDWVGSINLNPVKVDTVGPGGVKYNAALVVFWLGETDVAIAKMAVLHSDDDTTGNFVPISGLDWVGNYPGANDDNKLYAAKIDLRGKKRYLAIDFRAGNGTVGTYAVAFVVLYDSTTIGTAEAMGLAELRSA